MNSAAVGVVHVARTAIVLPDAELRKSELRLACDVASPLLGPRGAAATFGPQKGLRPADLPRLEAATARMAALLGSYCVQPPALAALPGAGAAGGIGFGLMAAGHTRVGGRRFCRILLAGSTAGHTQHNTYEAGNRRQYCSRTHRFAPPNCQQG